MRWIPPRSTSFPQLGNPAAVSIATQSHQSPQLWSKLLLLVQLQAACTISRLFLSMHAFQHCMHHASSSITYDVERSFYGEPTCTGRICCGSKGTTALAADITGQRHKILSPDQQIPRYGLQTLFRYHVSLSAHVYAELPLLSFLSLPVPVCNSRRRCLLSSIGICYIGFRSER